jgi:predicted HTH transcriptional regulator
MKCPHCGEIIQEQTTIDYSRVDYSQYESPTARSTDPVTSHIAGEDSKDFAEKHRAIALRTVKLHPFSTAAELAEKCSLTQHQLSRRLPELRDRGLVETTGFPVICRVRGTKMKPWIAT